jgi:hypothetical protein
MKKKRKIRKKVNFRKKKREREALWITIVTHGDLGVGETMISPILFKYC